MMPFGAGPSNLADAVSVKHTAKGIVAAALMAPWQMDGSQMLPSRSYSQSHNIPKETVKTQKTSIPTTGKPT